MTQAARGILQSAFGPRKEVVAHTVPLTSRETEVEAEALFKMTARRFLVGRGVAHTSSKLKVGAYVDLKGDRPAVQRQILSCGGQAQV